MEGKIIAYLERYRRDLYRSAAIADELVSEGVPPSTLPQTPEASAAKSATRTIPIVFTSSRPVIVKLVDSYDAWGNVTGIAQDTNVPGQAPAVPQGAVRARNGLRCSSTRTTRTRVASSSNRPRSAKR